MEGPAGRIGRLGCDAAQDLEYETSRLKQMYADLSLGNRGLKDVLEKQF